VDFDVLKDQLFECIPGDCCFMALNCCLLPAPS